mgnify:CR=1 FL=1
MLVVDQLTFGFRNRPLFKNVSFKVEPSKCLQLAGPNGVGKSTMMSILAGLIKASEGTIEFETDGKPEKDRREFVEYLPAEANGLYMKMDALSNLTFWAKLRGADASDQDLTDALERWDLNHPFLRDGFPVEKFSTGMKRRLALARMSLSNAPCWLLDEPLYGLDAKAVSAARELIQNHITKGGMAVVISHDLVPFEGLISEVVDLAG